MRMHKYVWVGVCMYTVHVFGYICMDMSIYGRCMLSMYNHESLLYEKCGVSVTSDRCLFQDMAVNLPRFCFKSFFSVLDLIYAKFVFVKQLFPKPEILK